MRISKKNEMESKKEKGRRRKGVEEVSYWLPKLKVNKTIIDGPAKEKKKKVLL